eukprot:TRINITY_DN13476_c0_g1_i2.p1 TRINITY_DN13476_c0_g1~~TRINITY_DN13476_c0_g1_i2.p1  ORF type:complete len:100 (-),score=42.76 TRINITY_DN13476_c0_g1_i2:9-308(-)
MYGFGDVREPNEMTLKALEGYVCYFVQQLLVQAYNRSLKFGCTKLRMSDVVYQVKDNDKMFMRCCKLLAALETVEKAKKKQSVNSEKEAALLRGEGFEL